MRSAFSGRKDARGRMTQPAQVAGRGARKAPLQSDRGQRVEEAFRRAQRHSGLVRALKFMLPGLAVLFVAAFLVRSYVFTPEFLGFSLDSAIVQNGKLVMSNPKLDGFTGDDRAYSMSAARATQPIGNSNRVDLEEINARLPFSAESWAEVSAPKGVFNRETNMLEIPSEMSVVTDDGLTALFQSALVDIDEGTLSTEDPVTIDMDGTRIAAESMRVIDKGARLIFEDKVRVHIDAERLEVARQSEGANDAN